MLNFKNLYKHIAAGCGLGLSTVASANYASLWCSLHIALQSININRVAWHINYNLKVSQPTTRRNNATSNTVSKLTSGVSYSYINQSADAVGS